MAFAVLCAGLCGCPSGRTSQPDSPTPLVLLHEDRDFERLKQNPELLDRVTRSEHGYFRFTNIRFASELCEQFADVIPVMPLVNLHGDAHLEQYAVTPFGRGLADYDDASSGPAVVDLVRFGVSIRLAAQRYGWDPEPVVAGLFDGYRAGLNNPGQDSPKPACAARIEAGFSDDRAVFLNGAEALMEPLDDRDKAEFDSGYERYVRLIRSDNTELPEHFFDLRSFGKLRTGVGSALDTKYLLRIEGLTRESDDDVILEIKELRSLSAIQCVRDSQAGGAFRILLGQARIGRQPIRFMAAVPPDKDQVAHDRRFWVQAWVANYRELNIDADLKSPEELREVTYDVGMQLGNGHVKQIASPFDAQLRRAQLRMLDRFEPRIRATIKTMAEQTSASWREFRRQIEARR